MADVKIEVDFAIIENINKNVEKMVKNTKGLGKLKLPSLSSAFKNISLGVIAANQGLQLIGRSLKTAGRFLNKFVDAARNIEDLQTQFTVLTKSVLTANKVIKDLQEFSARTPFKLQGIAESATQLLAFGFQTEQLIPLLQQLGDVAAGSGSRLKEIALIFGQVSAAGKLTGERLLQLQERGIPILDVLAEEMGVVKEEVRGLVTAGAIGFDRFAKAFSNLSSESGLFFQGMIRQSKTLSGVLSTLSDNVDLLFADIGKELLPTFKALALAFTKFIKDNKTQIKDIFQNVIVGVLKAFKEMVGLLGAIKKASDFNFGFSGAEKDIGFLNRQLVEFKNQLKLINESAINAAVLPPKAVVQARIVELKGQIATLTKDPPQLNIFEKLDLSLDEILKKIGTKTVPVKIKADVEIEGKQGKFFNTLFKDLGEGFRKFNVAESIMGGGPGALKLAGALGDAIAPGIGKFVQFFGQSTEAFAKTVDGFTQQLIDLPTNIAENIPVFIEKLVEAVPEIVDAFSAATPLLLDNLTKLMEKDSFQKAVGQAFAKSIIISTTDTKFIANLSIGFVQAFIIAIPTIADEFGKELGKVAGDIFGGLGGGGGIGGAIGGAVGVVRDVLGFQDGGRVPVTGLSLVHKDENVIDRSTNVRHERMLDAFERGDLFGGPREITVNAIVDEGVLAKAQVSIDQRGFRNGA